MEGMTASTKGIEPFCQLKYADDQSGAEFGERAGEASFRWFGCVPRRAGGCTGPKMIGLLKKWWTTSRWLVEESSNGPGWDGGQQPAEAASTRGRRRKRNVKLLSKSQHTQMDVSSSAFSELLTGSVPRNISETITTKSAWNNLEELLCKMRQEENPLVTWTWTSLFCWWFALWQKSATFDASSDPVGP